MKNSLPQNVIDIIKKELTILNPQYFDAIKYGRSVQHVEREIKLYQYITSYIRLPRGYLDNLLKIFDSNKIAYVLQDLRTENQCSFKFTKELWNFQQHAVDIMTNYEEGILVSPCGSGKTFMGIYLIYKWGQKTLWITHTKELLLQSTSQLTKLLNLEPNEIGMVGNSKFTIGAKVTVGLVQSLEKIKDPTFFQQFGTIIVDEAHHVPSHTFRKIVDQTSAKYRLGLTATPNRTDGLEQLMYVYMGPIIHKISLQELLHENKIVIPKVKQIPTSFFSYREEYRELMADLIQNHERNKLIVSMICSTFLKGKDLGLVLTERIQHCQIIKEMISSNDSALTVEILTGKVSLKKRKAIIQQMNNREIDILISTKLADEGLDIPQLNVLYLATPSKAISKIKQQIGRIMRFTPEKERALVFDFVDEKVKIFQQQALIRSTLYKEFK